jgi:predicted MFS family arabinose efflux permease
MALGYLAFGSVHEPIKEEVAQREDSFSAFLHNSFALLKSDKKLQLLLTTFLLAYGYLIALPFIILDAEAKIGLDGVAIGTLITMQMTGAMLSNLLWGQLSGRGLNKQTAHISIVLQMTAIVMAMTSTSLYEYMIIFFLIGAAIDGNRIASGNLILALAPAKKRPVYIALQTNILSLGMFFSILGGIVLQFFSYTILYSITLVLLFTALLYSFWLEPKEVM